MKKIVFSLFVMLSLTACEQSVSELKEVHEERQSPEVVSEMPKPEEGIGEALQETKAEPEIAQVIEVESEFMPVVQMPDNAHVREICDSLAGWKWSSDIGACVSKEITEGEGMYTWNGYGSFFGHGNDESPKTKDNPTPEYGTTYAFVDFECIVNANSDTLQKRMELTVQRKWDDLVKMLDEGDDMELPSALAIADCTDGVKDLDFGKFEDAGRFKPNWEQPEVTKRNCYLSGDYRGQHDQNNGYPGFDEQCVFFEIENAEQTWSWKSPNDRFKANSHLPTPWEFVEACGTEEGDGFNYDETDAFIWVAAIGYMSGADWAFGARNLGRTSCEKQNFEDTGAVNYYYGFRVVVR